MSNPTLSREQAEKLARSRGCTSKVLWLGLRAPGSQFGHYDDTLALITPDSYTEFLGNTLPSRWERGIACLQPGDYEWEIGLHGIHRFAELPAAIAADLKTWLLAHVGEDHPPIEVAGKAALLPYWAFRQAGPMQIIRNGFSTIPEPDGWPNAPAWIDGHRGGYNTTSSLACQTWQPDHWPEARAAGYAALKQYRQAKIPYCLHQL